MVKFITDILKSVITYLLFVIVLFVLSFSFATKEFPPSLAKMRKGINSLSDMMKMAQGLQAKSEGTSGESSGFDISGMAAQIQNLNQKNMEALNAIQEANTATTIKVGGATGGTPTNPDAFKERFAFLERQNQNILSKIDRIENYLADLHSKVIAPQQMTQQPAQQPYMRPAVDPAAAAAAAAAALKAKALQAQQK